MTRVRACLSLLATTPLFFVLLCALRVLCGSTSWLFQLTAKRLDSRSKDLWNDGSKGLLVFTAGRPDWWLAFLAFAFYLPLFTISYPLFLRFSLCPLRPLWFKAFALLSLLFLATISYLLLLTLDSRSKDFWNDGSRGS